MNEHQSHVDSGWMKHAIALAERGKPSPNPRVGCVIVRDGTVVGEGWHEFAGGPHAEVAALKAAGDRARGASAYITLEPCNHHGRTPPCTEALIAMGVSRVVFGLNDPNPNVTGNGATSLVEAGISVTSGVEVASCESLVASWKTFVTRGVPQVILKVAMSMDGRIATHTRDSKWITNEEARHDAHRLRAHADAVLVGVGTVLSDDPLLTPRNVRVVGQLPARIVLDSQLRTPTTSMLAKTAHEARVWIFCAEDALASREVALRALGVEVFRVALENERIGLRQVLARLGERGIVEVLVEGGGAVHGSFLDARLGDQLVAYLAPILIGGRDAFGAFGGVGADKVSDAPTLRDCKIEPIGTNFKLTAELRDVHRNHSYDR